MHSYFSAVPPRQILKKWLTQALAALFALCAFAMNLSAQHKNDSLLATFQGIADDSIRVDSMFKIVFKLGSSDPMLGMWLIDQAEAEPWAKQTPWARARAHNLRGIIYFSLKITDLAMENLLEAARIADTFGIERVRVNSINNIGTIQENEGRFEEALVSYRKARAGYLKKGPNPSATMALTNVALVYMDLEQYDRALEVCDSVIQEIQNPDDANAFAQVYGLMGEIYKAQKDYPRALKMFDLSIDLGGKAGDEYAKMEDMIMRAEVYCKMGMNEKALADLAMAEGMVKAMGVMPLMVDCYNLYAKIAKQQGNAPLALDWIEKAQALSDSLHREESATALANYQAIYDVNQKDKEIDLLNKDKEIRDANLLKVRYLFGLAGVVLVAMMVILIVLLRNNKARRSANLELQKKNEELKQLNHEMTGLLHVVAHDLKAPLNQVSGLISMVEEDGNLNDRQAKMLSMAQKVTNGAANLVQDLVELGSAEGQDKQLQRVPVSMNALVTEVASAFAAEATRKSISIEPTLPHPEIVCHSVPSHLRRILENLVSNALKFSPSGTTVRIVVAQEGKMAKVTIQDQGPGISPADQKNLYRKFHKLSARPTGGESSSGLGLAIVKTLVEQLGGEISLTSEVGKGATFVVSIPCAEAK